MSKADAENVLQVFRHTLEMELPEAGKIILQGIATFEVVEKAARKFKPAKELADKVNH
jgi:DNA-binding protein HU-beta